MIFYALVGVLSGVVSGMGIGGGAVLIPALVIFGGMPQQAAQSINLIYFIPTAAVSLAVHVREGNVEKGIVLKLILFGSAAAVCGSLLAVRAGGGALQKLFGAFLLVIGVFEFFKKE